MCVHNGRVLGTWGNPGRGPRAVVQRCVGCYMLQLVATADRGGLLRWGALPRGGAAGMLQHGPAIALHEALGLVSPKDLLVLAGGSSGVMAAAQNAKEGGSRVLPFQGLCPCAEGEAGVSLCARSTGHAPARARHVCAIRVCCPGHASAKAASSLFCPVCLGGMHAHT